MYAYWIYSLQEGIWDVLYLCPFLFLSICFLEMYQFSVSEGMAVGTLVGRVMATDADMGENTDMSYLIKDEEGGDLFRVSTDTDTQEAIIIIKKVHPGLLQYVK